MKLAIFDVDGTLLQNENPYLTLSESLGIAEEILPELHRYLNDEISYNDLIKFQMPLFKSAYKKIYGEAPIKGDLERLLPVPLPVEGAKETIERLKEAGIKVFILSSGLYFIVKEVMRYGIPGRNILANDFLYDSDGKFSSLRVSVKADKINAYDHILKALDTPAKETFIVADNAFESRLIDHALAKGSQVYYARKESKLFEMEELPDNPLFRQFDNLIDIPDMLSK